jgi:hypothetical protein
MCIHSLNSVYRKRKKELERERGRRLNTIHCMDRIVQCIEIYNVSYFLIIFLRNFFNNYTAQTIHDNSSRGKNLLSSNFERK